MSYNSTFFQIVSQNLLRNILAGMGLKKWRGERLLCNNLDQFFYKFIE